MPLAQLPPGKKQEEYNLAELLKQDAITLTDFGRQRDMMNELGRRLLEFKDRPLIINEVGLGIKKLEGAFFRGGEITTTLTYETFEILNQIRNAGIKPGEFTLYAIDMRDDVLSVVRSLQLLLVPKTARDTPYFKNFLPDLQEKEAEYYMPVRIPEDYRGSIECVRQNLREAPAHKLGHITFSFVYQPVDPAYQENLVRSTRFGGYIMTDQYIREELVKRFNLEYLHPSGWLHPIYRLNESSKV